jgi:hypothetical protein
MNFQTCADFQFTTAREWHTCEVPVYVLDKFAECLDGLSIMNLAIASGSRQYKYTRSRPWTRRRLHQLEISQREDKIRRLHELEIKQKKEEEGSADNPIIID